MGLFDGLLGGISGVASSAAKSLFGSSSSQKSSTARKVATGGASGFGGALQSFLPSSRTINTTGNLPTNSSSFLTGIRDTGKIQKTMNTTGNGGLFSNLFGIANNDTIRQAGPPVPTLVNRKPQQPATKTPGLFPSSVGSPFMSTAGAGIYGPTTSRFSAPGTGVPSLLDKAKSKMSEGFKSLLADPEKLKKLIEQVKGAFGGGKGGGGGDVPGAPAGEDALEGQLNEFGLAGPLNATLLSRLKEMLDQPISNLNSEEEQAILRDIDKSEQQELDYVMDQYKNLRPGADIESDSSFRRDVGEVREKYARVKQDALARARRQVRDDYTRNLLNSLQLGQRAGEFTTNQLGGLNDNEIERLAAQFGLNFEQSQRLRDTFTGSPFGF